MSDEKRLSLIGRGVDETTIETATEWARVRKAHTLSRTHTRSRATRAIRLGRWIKCGDEHEEKGAWRYIVK